MDKKSKRIPNGTLKKVQSRELDVASEPRPGDDNFEGFRMTLPEDCVEYMLFIIGDKTNSSLPSLEQVRRAAYQKLDKIAKDYIWQRDPFKLETRVQKGTSPLE
jgi:SGT1 protein.